MINSVFKRTGEGFIKTVSIVIAFTLFLGVLSPVISHASESTFTDEEKLILENMAKGERDFAVFYNKGEEPETLMEDLRGTFYHSIISGGRAYVKDYNDGRLRYRFEVEDYLGSDSDKKLYYETVKDIIDILIDEGDSEEVRIRKIVQWLHDNIEYSSKNDRGISPHSAFRLISDQSGYCQVYAANFQLMAEMAGLDSVYMVGKGRKEMHAWNLVKLSNGEWVGVDATWHLDGEPFFYKDMNQFSINRELPENLYEVVERKLARVRYARQFANY